MLETALVVDQTGRTLGWHRPPGRSAAHLPDSRALWDFLWEKRDVLGGVAHSHPWFGRARPSHTDVTTFAAIEMALGRRLVWPVVTLDDVAFIAWVGPGRWRYRPLIEPPWALAELEQLRADSC